MDLLNSEPVIELSGNEFLPKEGITFAQQVNEYFQSQGGKAKSPFGEVLLDLKGVQNSKQHGMSRIKAVAFAAIKDVLENGVVILPMGRHGVHDKKQLTGMIAAPIQIGNENYICVVEVIANLQVQRLYVHEAFVTKNLQEVAASNSVHGSETTSPQPQGEVAKVLQNYITNSKNKENNQTIGMNTIVYNNGTTRAATKWTHGADEVVDENKTSRKFNKKQVIRLNEAQFKQIVTEAVKKVLKERIAGEKGMSDAEVMRRRNDNFIKDKDYTPNSLWGNPFEPNYGDRIEMNAWFETPEETEFKVASDRYDRHLATQNHKYNDDLEEIVYEAVKRTLKESSEYTMDDWRKDGTLKLEIGQKVDDEVLNQLINSVPPHYSRYGYFQPGEPYDIDKNTWEDLYMTFEDNTYIGLKPSLRKHFKQHT